ncbi:MFS transporter [Glaciimonas sp. PAMC28666]|uniref:MFS transporter n=1 Tax=Glaciimonas sp. PAMC28666 TaxID=2807626 RepID=UPI001965EA95|nr:MFS transporter [Glaciimonas sp. PAMC28666]QRX81778.1 MFS transporter [Glaciimonas sp. PAMC28666]
MKYTAGQRLDRLPESSFHRRLAALIGAGLFFDAFDLFLASGVMMALSTSGWATMAQNAQFASAGAVGASIGALLAGWVGDKFGRRFAFQFNLLLFGTMSIAAACAPSMTWLIVCRFLMGIGLGAEVVVGYSTISEFVPPQKRGKWGAIIFFIATSALPVSSLVSYLVIPHFGWRWMFVIAGTGAFVVWYLRKKMPESPRWLESAGRHAEARQVLDEIEAEVSKKHILSVPVSTPVPAKAPTAAHYRLIDLFKPPLLRSTLLGMTLNIVPLSAVYGFIVWLPTFLVKQGLSVTASLGHTALMNTGSLIGIFLAGRYSDKWGRKKGIIALSVITAGLGWWYSHAGSIETTALIGITLIASIYCMGTLSFSTYVPELFPTELRLRGTSISSTAGRVASILAPQAVSILYAYEGGVSGVMFAIVGLMLAQAIIMALFGIDMTGRSLDAQAIEIPVETGVDASTVIKPRQS